MIYLKWVLDQHTWPIGFSLCIWKGFKACANDYTCASNCVRAYMKRYIGGSGCPANCESYARIHNGGPRGCRYPSTLRYWEKVHQQGCNVNSWLYSQDNSKYETKLLEYLINFIVHWIKWISLWYTYETELFHATWTCRLFFTVLNSVPLVES